ncbi:MAG: DUF1993 domain-containing protein [Methyloceanibacter sp.]
MSLSMYQASVPVFLRMLANLSAMLHTAASYAAERKIDESVLLNWRLSPDMFPLLRQVLIATDFAKGTTARLAGVEVPKYADDEKSFAELQQRIAKTVSFVQTLKPADIDGSEGRDIELSVGGRQMRFKGQPYLLDFALPNFYFHVTTAYGLLRACGVGLGKMDFLGPV